MLGMAPKQTTAKKKKTHLIIIQVPTRYHLERQFFIVLEKKHTGRKHLPCMIYSDCNPSSNNNEESRNTYH